MIVMKMIDLSLIPRIFEFLMNFESKSMQLDNKNDQRLQQKSKRCQVDHSPHL